MECPCGLKFSVHACPCGSHYTVSQCKCSRTKEDGHAKDGYESPKEGAEETGRGIGADGNLRTAGEYSGQEELHDNLSSDSGDSETHTRRGDI